MYEHENPTIESREEISERLVRLWCRLILTCLALRSHLSRRF